METDNNCEAKYNLRPVWDALLEVYKCVSLIFDRHNIKYWCAFGTVLGAARHRGFIPWDDDFDIYIPNAQIDRAVGILKRELPDFLKVITFENTPEFEEIYVKVQETRREIVDAVERGSNTKRPQGVYVDIFPLDGIPDSKVEQMILQVKSFALFCHWNARFNKLSRHTWRYCISALIAYITAPFFRQIRCVKDIQLIKKKWAHKYCFGETSKCGRYVGLYNRNYLQVADTMCFDGSEMLDFERIKVPVPKDFCRYLTSIYGDWQKLPPIERRDNPSHESLSIAPWKFGPTQPIS